MLIKVCGITHNEDLVSISQMQVDFAGFIFIPSSPRYAAGIDRSLTALLSRSAPRLKKTGVFLDEDIDDVRRMIEDYSLDAVQLHGNESPEYCETLQAETTVIKTFPVGVAAAFSEVHLYEGHCSYFLFDTAGPLPGGNGYSFDWSLLDEYEGSTSFFLSGGIGPTDVQRIYEINHPMFAGIDINSRFELYPGKKEINRLKNFVNAFKTKSYDFPGF